MKLKRLTVTFCAIALFAAAPAYSSIISTYSDRTTWQSATSGTQTVTFENFSPATGLGSVAWDGVTFSGTKNSNPASLQIFNTSALSFYDFGTHLALAMQVFGSQTFTYHVALPAAVTSFAVDLFSGSPSSLSYSVDVAGNSYTVPTFTPKTVGFFGATFDAPVTNIDITGTAAPDGSLLFLDNFAFGASAAPDPGQVPEAGTPLMIGAGLLTLAAIRRRVRA